MKKNRSKLQKAIQTPGRALMNIIYHFPKFSAKLDDEKYVRFIYKWCFKKKLDLENPKTFSEKLQWIKLYDHNELYTRVVDKYAVKEYIASQIGEEYIIPTIGLWSNFDEIDFEKLPQSFVNSNFFLLGREWPYKGVKPQIIAEPYISDSNGELNDYKFFCFNGQPKMLFIASDRGIDTRFDFFDMDFNHLPFEQGHPNSTKVLKKPDGFDHMKEEWDEKMGSWIVLPS